MVDCLLAYLIMPKIKYCFMIEAIFVGTIGMKKYTWKIIFTKVKSLSKM